MHAAPTTRPLAGAQKMSHCARLLVVTLVASVTNSHGGGADGVTATATTCGKIRVHATAAQLRQRRALQQQQEEAASSPGGLVVPPWDLEPLCRGAQCVDASLDHRPRMENNSRWAQWAVPEGTPPPGGWPVYLDFLVFSRGEDDFTRRPQDGHCGNGYGGGQQAASTAQSAGGDDRACQQFLNSHCPEIDFVALGLEGEANCTRCVDALKQGALQAAFEGAGCSEVPDSGGGGGKKGDDDGATKSRAQRYCTLIYPGDPPTLGFEPFDTPRQSMASCFNADGSWRVAEVDTWRPDADGHWGAVKINQTACTVFAPQVC
jgi:hypothetical protein